MRKLEPLYCRIEAVLSPIIHVPRGAVCIVVELRDGHDEASPGYQTHLSRQVGRGAHDRALSFPIGCLPVHILQ
jgi:hypothetical protein